MAGLRIKGVVFDMDGTVVDVGALAEACKQVASEPVAFNTQWRAKQLEYSFPRADMSAGVGISTLVSNAQFFIRI
jgi:beta-phosphoglucomutase-like phosphatase (HAD superfamily)